MTTREIAANVQAVTGATSQAAHAMTEVVDAAEHAGQVSRTVLDEVAAIGRNFNQMARALNAGERGTGPDKGNLLAVLRVLDALRIHFRGLLDANSRSWEVRHAKARD